MFADLGTRMCFCIFLKDTVQLRVLSSRNGKKTCVRGAHRTWVPVWAGPDLAGLRPRREDRESLKRRSVGDGSSSVLNLLTVRCWWLTVSKNGPLCLWPYRLERSPSRLISEAKVAPFLALPVGAPFCNVSLQLPCRGEEPISTSLGWPCDTFGLWEAAEGTPYWFPAQSPCTLVLISLLLSTASNEQAWASLSGDDRAQGPG